ncbi:MAG: hypothetical protein K2J20_02730 [Bacilli bacterium]|nr:hypothetical protein [Bacilli bacterium]
MDKKTKLIIIMSITLLCVAVGMSFAYFVSITNIDSVETEVSGNTTKLEDAKLEIKSLLDFDDKEVYPGHQMVSIIKATATGNNDLIKYNLQWTGTNTIQSTLKFKVYKTDDKIDVKTQCEKKVETIGDKQRLSEECNISNIDKLGEIIKSGDIVSSTEKIKVKLVDNDSIIATKPSTIVYYYIIMEYPNLEESQDEDLGGALKGKIIAEQNLEKSQGAADTTLAKLKVTPNSGTPDFSKPAKANCEAPNHFNNPDDCDTSTNGIYSIADDDGKSYYYRGAVENNYLKFGKNAEGKDMWWRIIRINGDGTIRLIYDGTEHHANGTSTTDSIAVANQTYSKDDLNRAATYVGFMTGVASNLDTNKEKYANINKSNAMEQLEQWYQTNLISYASYIDTNAGFCGDRSIVSETYIDPADTVCDRNCDINNDGICDYKCDTDGDGICDTNCVDYTPEQEQERELLFVSYGPLSRTRSAYSPSLSCRANDLYTISGASKGNKALTYPIGLITADEVLLAGSVNFDESEGANAENRQYYLYNKQHYWTMSPASYGWYGAHRASVFSVVSDGSFAIDIVAAKNGLRPVINLKADVQITGSGTANDPYIVS